MKKFFALGLLGASLCSCSLLQRYSAKEEGTENRLSAESDPNEPLFTPSGQEISSNTEKKSESEISRLNTKIAALETKVDVLQSNLERIQAQRAQPIIEAEPQKSLAAPVASISEDEPEQASDQMKTSQVSAAPKKPASNPVQPKHFANEAKMNLAGAEKDFRAGMELFQNSQYLESASQFALTAKKFPTHLLASHALYWAGEAGYRSQQWSIAIDNWTELEKRYPHSSYIAEALAGLSKAHHALGDSSKAKLYRALLAKAFPKAPVAMKSESEPVEKKSMKVSENTKRLGTEDEDVPVFEENSTSNSKLTAEEGTGEQ